LRRPWPHPPVTCKYNPLQRIAYLAMPLLGVLAVARLGDAQAGPVEMARGALRELRGGAHHSFLDDGSIRHLRNPARRPGARGRLGHPPVDGHRLVLPGPSAAWTRVIAPVSAAGWHSPNGWPSPTS